MARPRKNFKHGERGRYILRGCRCKKCVEAHRAYNRKMYMGRILKRKEAEHGTISLYSDKKTMCKQCGIKLAVGDEFCSTGCARKFYGVKPMEASLFFNKHGLKRIDAGLNPDSPRLLPWHKEAERKRAARD